MSERRRRIVGRVSILIAASLLCGVSAGLARAGNEDAEKAYWQNRYHEIVAGITSAERSLEESRAAYTKAKQRNRLKGSHKAEIMEAIAQAETSLARYQKQLDAFPEEARRAGVPPGWLREAADRS